MAASKKKDQQSKQDSSGDEGSDVGFIDSLIKDLNREHQSRIAWNLSTDTSPTDVKRWISTGSKLLDYAIANKRNGGFPEGRIVEIFGPPSIGKSHLAIQVAKSTQSVGGIVVYCDCENATSLENLKLLGIDVSNKFIYTEPGNIEEVFSLIESTILKIRSSKKDVPLTIIWDSLASVPSKAELEADYEQNGIGLSARATSKGMRKITQLIGNSNVLLVILNQTRIKIGVMHGDPNTTPNGSAVPFHSSVRVSLTGGSKIGESDDGIVGINVNARIVKNKIAPPFRKVSFQIHFGKGIFEHEEIFDVIRAYVEANGPLKKDGKEMIIEGTNAWKTMTVTTDQGEVLIDKKFHKADFEGLMKDPKYSKYIDDLLEYAMVKLPDTSQFVDSNKEITEEGDE